MENKSTPKLILKGLCLLAILFSVVYFVGREIYNDLMYGKMWVKIDWLLFFVLMYFIFIKKRKN